MRQSTNASPTVTAKPRPLGEYPYDEIEPPDQSGAVGRTPVNLRGTDESSEGSVMDLAVRGRDQKS